MWEWFGNAATRRPALLGNSAEVLLLSCAVSLSNAQFGISDQRVLPASTLVRQTGERVRSEFPEAAGTKLSIVLSVADLQAAGVASGVDRYARQLSSITGVAAVDTTTGSYRAGHRITPPTRHITGSPERA
ncbi:MULTISPECIES: hypothetical protein [unclassified Streptomyces]|uniref:hypothetical protein n=1 Tax=unclassified Streptomyces TaxID=2593676 RepID=UPI002E13D6BC|nr:MULTISPECIES: hypothetical protein [unclassified Streptomyces]WSR22244.1 hypothetical protein OG573_26015 [Streptomyces sp. NBC_01205]